MSEALHNPNADALLARVQRDESRHGSGAGRLHVFLGMCPGVGKTYAMLQAARQRVKEGTDVLVAVVETHGRQETAALVEGLTVLPPVKRGEGGRAWEEMDLDAVLARRPGLVLVDELAHTNAPGSRHAKRYQDVLEILAAGLHVYTTLNVQHIESQVDIVRQISGIAVQEKVPDSLLDRADEIQLIDLGVEKLLERLKEGRVYMGERAGQALEHFFKESTLTALRELALRFTAEHVDRDLEEIRRARRVTQVWKTNARLLVGVGPSPYAESLIRWTRRAAARLDAPWIVAWVEPSTKLDPVAEEALTHALALARRLGAEVVTVTGDDIATALLQLARERNVSQIVVGKTDSRSLWPRLSLADRIIAGSDEMDVCVVRPLARPSNAKATEATPAESDSQETASRVASYSWVLALTFALVSLCWALLPVTGYTFAALLLLLGVLVAGLLFQRGAVLLMATACALAWNWFFIPPRFTLHIDQPQDMLLFIMFFVVAFSVGGLTARLRQREQTERKRQRETAALLRLTQSAALAADPEKGLTEALQIIAGVMKAEVALIERQNDHSLAAAQHPGSTYSPLAKERGVMTWAFQNRQPAGRFTDTLPDSESTWFPLQTATSIMGLLGFRLGRSARLGFTGRQLIEALALQLALVLEKEHFIQAVNRAEVLEQSEKLRQTLLDSVSHELKTPLAIIQASLEGIQMQPPPPPASAYLQEISTASDRLQRVVDHLLQMTRLESAIVTPHIEWTDLRDVVDAASQAAGPVLQARKPRLHCPAGLPPVRLDAALTAQALANVLHNAAVYSTAEAAIEIHVDSPSAGDLRIRVQDHGPGFPPESVARVFEKFYRAPGAPAGGTGLGLAIARGLIRAQGGDVTAQNHPLGGAEITLHLPGVFEPPEAPKP